MIKRAFRRSGRCLRWFREDVGRFTQRRKKPQSFSTATSLRQGDRSITVRRLLIAPIAIAKRLLLAWHEVTLIDAPAAFNFDARPNSRITPSPRHILYFVYNSLPYHSAGYATRTHGLAAALLTHAWEVRVVTRAGYPNLFAEYKGVRADHPEVIDHVTYVRLPPCGPKPRTVSTKRDIEDNVGRIVRFGREFRPRAIHAASNFVTGIAGIAAARRLGIPAIYEVRGLWEETQASREPEYTSTLRYKQAVRMETTACLAADCVITITAGLRNELIARGIPGAKISIIPNGVDTRRFRPLEKNWERLRKLGIADGTVILGYIGSIVDYEGVDDLLYAVYALRGRTDASFHLLIAGDGAHMRYCQDFSEELGITDKVSFLGRIAHSEVQELYAMVDIAPFPRKPLQVCEMVSPLKPFEAMAMEKCIVVSSVEALREIVEKGNTGLVFEKGQRESLIETLRRAIDDTALRNACGEAARKHVVARHDWAYLAAGLSHLYASLDGI